MCFNKYSGREAQAEQAAEPIVAADPETAEAETETESTEAGEEGGSGQE